ncbi:hypothetical protein D3C71_1745440 [compost metagenome]
MTETGVSSSKNTTPSTNSKDAKIKAREDSGLIGLSSPFPCRFTEASVLIAMISLFPKSADFAR